MEHTMPSPALPGRWIQTAAALAMLTVHASTWAHQGHGMEGSHWHATDIWGVLAVAAAAALLFRRRK